MNPYYAMEIANAVRGPGIGSGQVEPWQFAAENPVVAPTVDPSLTSINLTEVASTEQIAPVNPTPYIGTQRAGVRLSSTKMDEDLESMKVEVSKLKNTKQLELYQQGITNAYRGAMSIVNGFTSYTSYKMQARNKNWQAEQNLRAAELLRKNQREITRAAQADANVYKVQGRQTKANQKVAMAQSGFAVGKGVYRNTLDTTDARTNYNVSAVILKSELQNAELTRRAGQYRAESIINNADAKIALKQGKNAIWQGIAEGAVYLTASGVDFYIGKTQYK